MIVHSPCRSLNLQAKYMKNGTYTKHFPKPHIDITTVVDEDYPNYIRISLEHSAWKFSKMRKGTPQRITNLNIVVYYPYLL